MPSLKSAVTPSYGEGGREGGREAGREGGREIGVNIHIFIYTIATRFNSLGSGNSAAGKSESLSAFRKLAAAFLKIRGPFQEVPLR